MHHRYFLRLSYNGSEFSGWQFQPNAPSVQEELEKTISALLHEKITCIGCGRTDAGVHASKYYAHIDATRDDLHTDEKVLFRLNKSLPPAIAIQEIIRMPENAHARFSATSRSYQYFITRKKNVFGQKMAWEFHEALDVGKMNEAAQLLLKHDDFVAFSKTGNTMSTTICKLSNARWEEEEEGMLVFHISSNRFLRNMVRAIVGTLVEIGKGNAPVSRVDEILHSKTQPVTGFSVPANGLFLSDIKYPEGFGLV